MLDCDPHTASSVTWKGYTGIFHAVCDYEMYECEKADQTVIFFFDHIC